MKSVHFLRWTICIYRVINRETTLGNIMPVLMFIEISLFDIMFTVRKLEFLSYYPQIITSTKSLNVCIGYFTPKYNKTKVWMSIDNCLRQFERSFFCFLQNQKLTTKTVSPKDSKYINVILTCCLWSTGLDKVSVLKVS